MKSFAALALFAASLAPAVSAHGFVSKITIDGKAYNGLKPWGSGKSVIRRVDNTEPNHIAPSSGTKNDKPENMACGRGAATRAAGLVADAMPGSKITVLWDAGDGSPWPHNQGPLMEYIAECDAAGCDKTDATKVKWAKIAQVGKKPNKGNHWYQEDLMKKGAVHSFTLPDNIKPGNYLVQHTILALHIADKTDGAEFYPACFNVKIGGSGTGSPSVTAQIPGAYKLQDKGVHINIFDNVNAAYSYPGPAIATWGGSSSKSDTTDDSSAVTDPASSGDDTGSSGDDTGSSGDDTGSSGGDDTGSGDSGSGGDDDCADEGDNTGSGSEDPTPASGATKTVTVTVTVTATPTSGSSSQSKSNDKSDYKRSPLRIRRSRAHHVARSS